MKAMNSAFKSRMPQSSPRGAPESSRQAGAGVWVIVSSRRSRAGAAFPLRPRRAGTAGSGQKKAEGATFRFFLKICAPDYTQPVGLGRPAILQAPLPGPEGKSSYTSFSL